MGHRNIATTQRYTHLRPVHEIPAHERLADAVPIADLVTATAEARIREGCWEKCWDSEQRHSMKLTAQHGQRSRTASPHEHRAADHDFDVISARP